MAEFVEEMYIGEKKRDASSKVRGFIYQDLLAVEQLIDSNDITFELYSEWAEDIYSESDDKITITQVKYYTSDNNINFTEIYTELFYQYLRLKMLECNKKITCKLSYYAKCQDNGVGTACHILKNISDNTNIKIGDCDLSILNTVEKQAILNYTYHDNNGKSRGKDKRENYLYEKASNYDLLKEFINSIYVEDFRNEELEAFREYLKEKLYEEVDNNTNAVKSLDWDKKLLSDVCFAISVIYIQESYNKTSETGALRRRTKDELMTRLVNIVNGMNKSETISCLLQCYVDECLMDYILEDESLENRRDVIKFYENLAASTKEFLNEFLNNDDGQYALINTISKRRNTRINKDSYMAKSYVEKSHVFMEYRESFNSFLLNIWKILYNMNCNEFGKYIKADFSEYLRFDFPQQAHSVILPSLGTDSPKKEGEYVYSRFKELKERPHKWLWRNEKIRGPRNYELDVKNIVEELKNNTAYILDDMFIVECMQCIKLEDSFSVKEICEECIFSDKCSRRNGVNKNGME